MRVIILVLLFTSQIAFTQCLLREVPLENRVNTAVQIVEGQVVDKYSFWDDENNNIFTLNKIEIYKTFKGQTDLLEVEVITLGGVVGLHAQVVEPSLQLKKGDKGIFFLASNKSSIDGLVDKQGFLPEAGPQGYISYSENEGVAKDAFNTYFDLQKDLYQVISGFTKTEVVEVKSYSLEKKNRNENNLRQLAFTFSPSTITAGTDAILTISDAGGGLGTQGEVRFTNADQGGAVIDIAALDAEICSWSTTEIQVQVPRRAGTGNFEVIPDGQSAITSTSSLTVTYSQLNAISSSSGVTDSYQTQHYDDDGLGGYTWQMNDDFAVSGAAAPFQRSLETWCAATNIHWQIGGNTSIDVIASDGINVVRFDNGAELPSGVLGRCTSRWSGCFQGSKDCIAGTNSWQWYVVELDIAFDDGTTWNYGPDATTISEYDFESVSLHELGHGHQLGHVRDASQVMYYSISNGSDKRTLGTAETNGALDVYDRSTTSSVCGNSLMATDINCASLVLPVELMDFSVKNKGESANLSWTTASEINNRGFEIQRSNENNDFVRIDFVSGKGNSNTEINYNYEDTNPLSGLNYYRLRQLDYDGNYSYSEVESAYFTYTNNELSLFPIPAQGDYIKLKSILADEAEVNIELIDITGSVLSSKTISLPEGVQLTPISIGDYPQGTYFVKCHFANRIEVLKFIKTL